MSPDYEAFRHTKTVMEPAPLKGTASVGRSPRAPPLVHVVSQTQPPPFPETGTPLVPGGAGSILALANPPQHRRLLARRGAVSHISPTCIHSCMHN